MWNKHVLTIKSIARQHKLKKHLPDYKKMQGIVMSNVKENTSVR